MRSTMPVERRANPQQWPGGRSAESDASGIQSAAGDPQVMQFFGIVPQTSAGLMQMPCRQVAAKVRKGNLNHRHGGIYLVGLNSGGGGANPTDLSPSEYFVSDAASSAQLLRRVFTKDRSGAWSR